MRSYGIYLWHFPIIVSPRRAAPTGVYDWAADVEDAWFIDDGIHFTTPGYRARARLIADALAAAFPSGGGRSPGCVVY